MQKLTKSFGEPPPLLRKFLMMENFASALEEAKIGILELAEHQQELPGEPGHSHETQGTENFGREQDHCAKSFSSSRCQWVRGSHKVAIATDNVYIL